MGFSKPKYVAPPAPEPPPPVVRQSGAEVATRQAETVERERKRKGYAATLNPSTLLAQATGSPAGKTLLG